MSHPPTVEIFSAYLRVSVLHSLVPSVSVLWSPLLCIYSVLCIYAGVNIPISGFSTTYRLDMRKLPDLLGYPGDPKRCVNQIETLKSWFHFYLIISTDISGLNWWFPHKIHTVTHTQPNHVYRHTHMYIHTHSQLTTIHIYIQQHVHTKEILGGVKFVEVSDTKAKFSI